MSLRPFTRYFVHDVFVPGGIPNLTYNPRKQYDFEAQLERGKKRLNKLILVTGQTKSGKTVLVNRIYSREETLWLEGGHINSMDDFWSFIAAKLQVMESKSNSDETNSSGAVSTKVSSDGILSALGFKAEVSATGSVGGKKASTIAQHVSIKNEVIRTLYKKKTAIVIDDFHYLEKSLQGEITRVAKPLILEGIPIIFIAIPSHRYDVVKVEAEMTGRIMRVKVPEWDIEELRYIAISGFDALNTRLDDSVVDSFAEEAIGSPHLMQEFCKELCHLNQIDQTPILEKNLSSFRQSSYLFERVSEGTGRHLYEKLRQGPNQRTKRILRTLLDGRQVDIYELCLLALARMRPGLHRITYDALRASMTEIVQKEFMPQYGETSRVLEQVSRLSCNGNQKEAVIEWDPHDRILHITDPFFAFFLRWGPKA